jgi:hypothetical protein
MDVTDAPVVEVVGQVMENNLVAVRSLDYWSVVMCGMELDAAAEYYGSLWCAVLYCAYIQRWAAC